MRYTLNDVRAANARILSRDPRLAEEIRKIVRTKRRPAWLPSAATAMAGLTADVTPNVGAQIEATPAPTVELETIVQRIGRPVLAITRGDAQLAVENPDSQIWNNRLQQSASLLHQAIAAVGRVEANNMPMALPYVGTGWLVDSELVVTNRHVALEFAQRGSSGFSFQLGFDRKSPMSVDIDFLEELNNPAKAQFDISDILFIANDRGPDVAFLKVSRRQGDGAAQPIKLSRNIVPPQTIVATIGYPARDPFISDQKLMMQIFGDVFEKKRLAPGFVTGVEGGALTHDCTTLGGNSGSALIDLATGEAAGLHFAGIFLKTNYAVPGPVVANLLAQATEASTRIDTTMTATASHSEKPESSGDPMSSTDATFIIPLQITVTIGTPVSGGTPTATKTVAGDSAAAPPARAPTVPSTREDIKRAVAEARRQLARRSDVVAVEPGYRFKDGWITDERCVVVSVKQKLKPDDLKAAGLTPLPSEILGVPVNIAVAAIADSQSHAMLEAPRAHVSNYRPRPDLPLNEVEDAMTVIAHASPDAGWPILQTFLGRTAKRLTVGMYEFTAPHIVDAMKSAIGPAPHRLSLVLQNRDEQLSGTTANDLKEADTVQALTDTIGGRLSFAWASVAGPNRLFDTSYHIKLAVRDGEEFWLSSGSWRSSNQPPFDPIKDGDQSPPLIQQYDRDWHVVVSHAGLSDLFEKHLLRDETEAAALQEAVPAAPEPQVWVPEDFFRATEEELATPPSYRAPLVVNRRIKVQPLLTPDNYGDHVVTLIQSANHTLYFQNQSLGVAKKGDNGPVFEKLLQALLEKQQDSNVDVRIIFRRFGDPRKNLTLLKDFGFDTSQTRIRVQTNCHTKGIIVDGEKVLIGSQNWTNSGTAFNRDASLIFFDPEIAQYFQDRFLYDWNRVANNQINENLPAVELVKPDEAVRRPGRVPMPWSEWFGD